MKKIYLAVLSLVAAGCINKVPVDFGDDTPQLVLNAQLMASENTQAIYLSESQVATIKPLRGADVTILVDGKPFAKAEEAENEDRNLYNAAAYYFKGGFPEGSQVKVSAKKGSWDAWAQADVVPKPVISAVDTLRSIERDMDYTYEVFQVKITLKDPPGDNYYQAGVLAFHLVTMVDADGNTLDVPVIYEFHMNGSQDPVLGGTTAGLSMFDLGKAYLAFSDEMFRGQEYTLRLTINSEQLYPYYYAWDADFQPEYAIIHTTIIPWLESISREEYDYLNALNNLENFGYSAQMIVEPTTLPSNVNGGMGFFSVRTRTEAAPMTLRPKRLDYENWY